MTTQLFISWSGDLSHKVASLIHEWIPTVVQTAEPFLSSTDIEKGSRWSDHVAQKLEECGFGIIVLTSSNLTAPWILFEAGALSKMVGRAQVSSILMDVDIIDVKQPLSQFQNTIFSKDDMLRLIHSVNRAGRPPLRDDVVLRAFNALWPDLEHSVMEALKSSANVPSKAVETVKSVTDIDLVKSSLGELVQSVQSLRDELRRQDVGLLSGSPDLRREVQQIARSARNLPIALLKDIDGPLKLIEQGQNVFEATTEFSNKDLDDIIERLTRAKSYISRYTRNASYADDSKKEITSTSRDSPSADE